MKNSKVFSSFADKLILLTKNLILFVVQGFTQIFISVFSLIEKTKPSSLSKSSAYTNFVAVSHIVFLLNHLLSDIEYVPLILYNISIFELFISIILSFLNEIVPRIKSSLSFNSYSIDGTNHLSSLSHFNINL
jgi:hypothetical protein